VAIVSCCHAKVPHIFFFGVRTLSHLQTPKIALIRASAGHVFFRHLRAFYRSVLSDRAWRTSRAARDPQRTTKCLVALSFLERHCFLCVSLNSTYFMACARAAIAARVADAGPSGPGARRASTRLCAVHVSAGTGAASRTFVPKRFGAKRAHHSRGHPALAQAVAVNKATRSIDEMDMDPEHVTFASMDELDARCVFVVFVFARPRSTCAGHD
jgi:hypothetical protein